MAIGSKVSGNFKSASSLYGKVNGGWKKAKFGYIKVGGQWKQFWADKLEDTFNRIDTTSGLGTAESGQAWTVLRSQWRINSNNANTTGAKTDYPLASIDAGFLDFDLEANELTPGTGVAIRVEDANNWWGVVPFYNQTSTSYTYCVRSSQVPYCIAACTTPSGTVLRCDAPNTLIVEDVYDYVCNGGEQYEDVYDYVFVSRECPPGELVQICTTSPYCTDQCIKRGSQGQCLDRDTVCVDRTSCVNRFIQPPCEDIFELQLVDVIVTCPGGETLQLVGQSQECSPDGFTNVPVYDCCSNGLRTVCDETATGTTYNQYYYIQIIKMVNGVFSVVSSVEVPSRWSALKISAQTTNLTVTAYSDSLYTAQVGVLSTSVFNSVGTGYGIMARDSNYEDGRTIGSLLVKPLGQ